MPSFKLLISITLIAFISAQLKPSAIQYEWKYLNFTWTSNEIYLNYVKNNDYIKANNPIAGIKIWKGRAYLTIPRWEDGVPATLLVTSLDPIDGQMSPLLEPYPNWEMQRVSDCSAFQFVQSMEIDPLGRMWVIDTGRVAIWQDNPKNYCPPRLVILDLENGGKILLNYVFPEEVARRDTNYLNDIDLEHEDGGYAYITDTDAEYPGIIVFSLRDRTSWKVTDPSMIATDVNFTVAYDNTSVSRSINVNGIAISPASSENHRTLYYCPLSSLEIFTVPTNILKSRPKNISKYVRSLGRKPSQTGGMMMDAQGRLFFTLLALNSVGLWNTHQPPFRKNQHIVFRDDQNMQWPDTFAFDEDGTLWAVSNRLQRLLKGIIRTNETNFRVLKLAEMGIRNYQYYEDGDAPPLPCINMC